MSPSPDAQAARLAALEAYRLLGGHEAECDREFDEIVEIAAATCGVPMALIGLVDDRRQWFAAAIGLKVAETPHDSAFCAHALRHDGVFVVEDASRDVRFADHPLIASEPGLRFHAGAPLRTPDGVAVGTLWVLDREPRRLSEAQRRALAALGRLVMQRLERRRCRAADRVARVRDQIIWGSADYAIIATDLEGRITSWNRGAENVLGWTEREMIGRNLALIFTAEDRAIGRMETEMSAALAEGAGNDERWHLRKSGERFWANGEMTPIRDGDTLMGFLKVLRDRTEQHRANDALRASEERLRRAQAAGGVGVFSLDLESNRLTGTAEFSRIFGIGGATDAIAASAIEALVVPEDRAPLAPARLSDPETAPLDVEYRIRRADDGRLRWLSRKAEYERGPDGRPARLVGVVMDITDRRAAQRAAEESAAQFQTLAQTLPNHVWTADATGSLDWFNDRVYEYSGTQRGSFRDWPQLIHPDDRAQAAEHWSAALAAGHSFESEFRLRGANGAYRWHLARALPMRGEDGVISRWMGTNTDVHERKLSADQHSRDRERIWNSTNDLMGTLGADGFLKSVNPAWERLLGYEVQELLAHPFAHFIAEPDRARLATVMQRLRAAESLANLEDHLVHKDGRALLIAWSAEPVGGLAYIVGRNITEQRATEEALRQSQKMETVGQLTGGIAHDFNNLLQGITGSLDLVKKRLQQGRFGEIDRFVTGAMTSANRASALTHRLLAYSRRQPLDPKAVDANALLNSMQDILQRTNGETIQMDVVLEGGLWLTKCDPNQLESAVLNLVINARDAMPNGGTLTVQTSNAHVDDFFAASHRDLKAGDYVCIRVTDTGKGMSADTVAKAFEPFFTTKPLGQGTGLGLSMVYGFARQSEGHALLHSEIGRGTSVEIYLPRHRGHANERESPLELTDAYHTEVHETVLVVEDEPVVRALIVEVLQDLGYEAHEAGDGPSGLQILQSDRRIDLLVSDIGLPGMNGRQMVDAARRTRPHLRVLYVTGYAENAAAASGFLEPGMSLITKPFAMEALATRIREMLERPESRST